MKKDKIKALQSNANNNYSLFTIHPKSTCPFGRAHYSLFSLGEAQ